jgi:bifunctional non-homologous end joining protein LigD
MGPKYNPQRQHFKRCLLKLDGYRMAARIRDGRAELLTRNRHDWTDRLRHLAVALEELGVTSCWVDGEVVALDAGLLPDFGALQRAFATRRTADLVYFLFDVMYLDGYDLRRVALGDRQTILAALLDTVDDAHLRLTTALPGDGDSLLDSACRMGLEGIVAKRVDRGYMEGRSGDWLKIKCFERQEFVVGGFNCAKGARAGIRSLLIGVHEQDGSLRFCGPVAAALSAREMTTLERRLTATHACPFYNQPAPERDVDTVWVEPVVVVEVQFLEWTAAGEIRQGVLKGMREDKGADDVVQEVTSAPNERQPRRLGTALRVTNAQRIVDPSSGVTKGEVVRYYAGIAEWMVPHVAGRPLSLVRAPDGLKGELFFQKHAEGQRLRAVEQLPPELYPGHPPLLVANSADALVELAQLNVLEFHTWNATAPGLDVSDRLVFDLDPDPALPWERMLEAARLMRVLITELGLESFCKTSGGKGLHLVVPLAPAVDWDRAKNFSLSVARHIARVIPQRFVSVSGPKNRVGKIFVDYLRNGRGATTVSAFSLRARPGLGASLPVAWDELDTLAGADTWDVHTAVEHARERGADPWASYTAVSQTVTPSMLDAVGAGVRRGWR